MSDRLSNVKVSLKPRLRPHSSNLPRADLDRLGFIEGCHECRRTRARKPNRGYEHTRKCIGRIEAHERVVGDPRIARRDEIDVMRLVGAKTWFIRVPFYLEGAFQGIVSATCAVGLTWAGTQMIPTTQFVSSVSTHLPELEFISSSISAAVILGAGLMGIVASHLATGRFLKENA